MEKMPAFLFKKGNQSSSKQLMVACFGELEAHVSFTLKNGLVTLGKQVNKCNGSCEQVSGRMYDLSKNSPIDEKSTEKIINKAISFSLNNRGK